MRAGVDLAAGALLLRGRPDSGSGARWDGDPVAFDAGHLAFALWTAGSEAALRVDWA